MNFPLKLSLEHIALVKIAITLWNKHDVRTSVEQSSFSRSVDDGCRIPIELKGEWKNIEEKVALNVSQLAISTHLKEKVLCYTQAVGIQILKWMQYHIKCCNYDLGLPNKFCWSPRGTIDKRKTAEMLLKDESIDIITRYKLACTYCLEGDIFKLWNKIPENRKLESDNLSFDNEDIIEISPNMDLLDYWGKYVTEDEEGKDHMIYFDGPYMLKRAAQGGNQAATEYFFLQQIEREELRVWAAFQALCKRECLYGITGPPQLYCSEVLCFLLSVMNNEQQLTVFQKYPIQTLHCLLDWPWQNFFIEIVSQVWSFLPDSCYPSLLIIIIDKMKAGYKDHNYQKLFRYVWQQIPHSYKSGIINDTNFYSSFHVLLQLNDRENIKLIFEDTSLAEKK